MHKYVMVALVCIACIVGIVVTFDQVNEARLAKADEVVEDNELRIIADNFFFDQEEYTVVQGQTMKLTLRNKVGIHSALIKDLDLNIMEGEEIEYTFDKPGTYEIVCGIACGIGHDDMVAKLVVLEADQAGESTGEAEEAQ